MSVATGRARTIRVSERGWTEVELTGAQAAAIQRLRFCSVTPGVSPGVWRIGDVTHIGVASLPGLRIHIQPKTPLENILFLASYAEEQVPLGHAVQYQAQEGLPSALAEAFVRAVESCTRGGQLSGYRTMEETGHVVRGRWDIPRQIRTRPGIPLPLELTVSRFTPDIVENQVLLAAVRLLMRAPGVTDDLRRRLRGQLTAFEEVTPWQGREAPEVPLTRLNRHYGFALMLARLVIEATSWAHREGSTEGASFLISMPGLFERFVHRVLSRELEPRGLTVSTQDRAFALDEAKNVRLRPDLVIRRGDQALGIADLKYKVWNAEAGSPPNADVYQALAYALSAGLEAAHLIYVSGEVAPAEYRIASAGKCILAHTVDLSGAPDDILASVRRLATEIPPHVVAA